MEGDPGHYAFQTHDGTFASPGDLDHDGYDDLIVLTDDVARHQKQLWLLSGKDGSRLRICEVAHADVYPIAATGDMDGDDEPDYAIGAYDPDLRFRRVEVRSGADDSLIWEIRGSVSSAFGAIVGNVDLDRDGRPDLAITVNNTPGGEGAVFAYNHDGRPLWRRIATETEQVGWYANAGALDRTGDIDGDGVEDLVVGGYDKSVRTGLAVVLSGSTGEVLVRGVGPRSGPPIGLQVAGLGDLDADHVPDFAAGTGYQSLVMVFSGRTGEVLFSWSAPFNGFGEGLGSRVDLDVDGVPDVVVGDGSTTRVLAYSGRDGSEILHLRVPGSVGFGLTAESMRPHPGNPFGLFFAGDRLYGRTRRFGYRTRIGLYRASPPGVEVLGAPCAGTLPQAPQIGMRSLGAAGARVHLSQAPQGASAILLLGLSTTSWQGVPLPLSLDFAGFRGCALYTSIEATVAVTAGTSGISRGYGYVDLPVPLRAPGTVTLHGQWLVFGSGESWPGALSGGLTWQL